MLRIWSRRTNGISVFLCTNHGKWRAIHENRYQQRYAVEIVLMHERGEYGQEIKVLKDIEKISKSFIAMQTERKGSDHEFWNGIHRRTWKCSTDHI